MDEHRKGSGTGAGTETRAVADGDKDDNGDGNGVKIGKSGGEAKMDKKPYKSCRRHVGNEGDLGGKRKKCRKERVGLSSS